MDDVKAAMQTNPLPKVDLLIRTGGEQRLSNFLLWDCAYAELHFSDKFWPDFSSEDLDYAVQDYEGRDRRFGGDSVIANTPQKSVNGERFCLIFLNVLKGLSISCPLSWPPF